MLREFFVNEHPKFLFKQFGLIHNIFISIAIIGLIIIYLNRYKIAKISLYQYRSIIKPHLRFAGAVFALSSP